MSTLRKYNLLGEVVDEVSFDEGWTKFSCQRYSIKQYLVAILQNRRQWSANTKGRSEVNHSNFKPRRQKGLGRSRQGTIKAAQYRGGGIVFGPKPKFNQKVKVNQKERRAGIRYLFGEKLKEGALYLLQDEEWEKPQTKVVARFLKRIGIGKERVLFLHDDGVSSSSWPAFCLSLRNLPKVSSVAVTRVNGYDVIKHRVVILGEKAYPQFTAMMKGGKRE